jgi:hypothetical protein
MQKIKKFRLIFVPGEDELDVAIIKENGQLIGFSVNYRTKINHRWYDVIRYDSAHNVIHVQKFWISPKIIPLREIKPEEIKIAIIEAIDDIKQNWERYKNYLAKKVKENEG